MHGAVHVRALQQRERRQLSIRRTFERCLGADGNARARYHQYATGAQLVPWTTETICEYILTTAARLRANKGKILGSLAHHQETFLSSSPWRERPWATFPKNSVDSCLDALYSLPAVLRIWDEVLEATDPDEVRKGCLSAIREVSKVDIMLSGWLDGFQQTVSGATYTPTFSTLTSAVDEDGAKLFPLSFQFSAFTICYQMTTYWSGMMVVNEMMMLAYRKLAELDPSSGAGALAREHEETWVSMIRNICQSTECFEKPENGKVGLAVGVSMLRGCQLTLKDYPENWHLERAWLEESMWRIHKKLTIAVSRFVREG